MILCIKVLSNRDDAPKDYLSLSVSKAKTFDSCKAKFHFSYIQKLPRKDWDFHIFGKFNHEVLEEFHKKLLEDDTLDYNKLMTECFSNSIRNWKDKITKEQLDESKDIQTKYLKILQKQIKENKVEKVIDVEKSFYILLNDKILLNGFIDRVHIDPDGVLHVADYKTSKSSKYLKNDYFQLLTYAYVLMVEDESLEKIRGSYIMLRNNFEYVTKEFDRSEVMKVVDKFLNYEKEISEERLWRAEPSILCGYCDYEERCSDGQDYLIKIGKKPPKHETTKTGLISW